MPVSKYDIKLDVEKNPNSSHALVVGMVGSSKSVLDIGCDTGYLGEQLSAFGNTTSGFEVNEASAEVARTRYKRVEVGDLEAVDLSEVFDHEQFDVLVFADVLEHLRDPLPVLRAARALVAPGGSIIISVPNVAHGDLRLQLLKGTWRYTEVGLLDDTHTRFFTRDSLVEFIGDAGFTLLELSRTRLPLFGTEVAVDRADFDDDLIASLEDDDEATTYQFVVRIAPREAVHVADEQALLVDSLRADLAAAGRRELAQRHELLQLTDRAIGAEATVEHLSRKVAAADEKLLGSAAKVAKLTEDRDRHRARIKAMTASRSWRVGNALMAPAARVSRRRRA